MSVKPINYYHDLFEDNFEQKPKTIHPVMGDFVYVSEKLSHRFLAFFAYRLIATPCAFIYSKVIKRIKVVNQSILKPFNKTGYFVYANHTHALSDALSPSIAVFPKRLYTIVNASNISLPILGKSTMLLGALPLPDDLLSGKNFLKAIETRIKQGHSVLIYPEGNLWPYYTGVRPFKENSFKYPVRLKVPSFVMTTTYQETKRKKMKTVIYFDGPFFTSSDDSIPNQITNLHNEVLEAMRKRTLQSNYEKILYRERKNL